MSGCLVSLISLCKICHSAVITVVHVYILYSVLYLGVALLEKSHTHVSTVQVMLECGVESLVSVVTRELRPVNLLPASMREAHPFLVSHFGFSVFMLIYLSPLRS